MPCARSNDGSSIVTSFPRRRESRALGSMPNVPARREGLSLEWRMLRILFYAKRPRTRDADFVQRFPRDVCGARFKTVSIDVRSANAPGRPTGARDSWHFRRKYKLIERANINKRRTPIPSFGRSLPNSWRFASPGCRQVVERIRLGKLVA
jgi:hypothetical protein